jgi:hypothetical protein
VPPPEVKPAADIVQAKEKNEASQVAFPALRDDLVNAGSPSLAAAMHDGYTKYQGCRIEALNDGEPGVDSAQPGVAFDLDGVWTTTFVLATARAPKGYDINEIRTIAGWIKNRANQKYELLLAKIAAPGSFISLGVFEYAPNVTGSTRITLTKANGPLATGVAAIRFRFMPDRPGVQAETAYREIDVIGSPTP